MQLLSLTYCDIGIEGCQGLFEVILYQNSKLVELALTGNPFKNEGIILIFQALAAAKSIQNVYISDCQWDDSEEVMAAMKYAMVNN